MPPTPDAPDLPRLTRVEGDARTDTSTDTRTGTSTGTRTDGPDRDAPGRLRRRPQRVIAGLSAVLALAVPTVVSAPTASAEPAVKAVGGSFTVRGQGFGHGIGMSQYGAYGAARKGLSWQQILAFYYAGTTLSSQPAGADIRVWVTADADNVLRLVPTPGLRVGDAAGHSYLLPTGSTYRSWRISRSGSGYKLTYLSPSGAWKVQPTTLGTSTWTASNTARVMKVIMPGGVTREYRGSLSQAKSGTGGKTVNTVAMEDYLKGVVPSEMPTSWPADAVRSQAVAARSYAARLQHDAAAGTGYDICDTTNCQVYHPYASTSRGRRTVNETSGGNAAVAATARTILTWGGYICFTQFAASNGGYEIDGGRPYLKARTDPYDGVVTKNAWSLRVSAASVQRHWPSVGTVTSVQVTKRDGGGAWGGRVLSITIVGSKKTLSVGGRTFQSAYGLRSNLFTFN